MTEKITETVKTPERNKSLTTKKSIQGGEETNEYLHKLVVKGNRLEMEG